MKLMLGGTPVKKMMIHNDTMDATMVASDLQAGVTAYANGQKVTGTGKSFEFAVYGKFNTNENLYIPSNINVIQVASTLYPVQMSFEVVETNSLDFNTEQSIGNIIVDNIKYPIIITAANHFLTIKCDISTKIEVFYGKDNYV